MSNKKLITEKLSLLQRIIRYLKELIISIKNIPYEIGTNNNVPKVKDIEQTISLIKQGRSITRFGDGEFRLINGYSIPFQKFSKNLQSKLIKVIKIDNPKLLIGLPDTFHSLQKYTFLEKIFWRKYMSVNRKSIYKLIDVNNTYVSAFFSRPYLRFKNKTNTKKIFTSIKKIWTNKNIVIIEGDGTRIGVGNDLLKNAKSVKRIICPNINAFEKYSFILKTALQHKNCLFLIALGPTAKILTYDLSEKGFQAIDIGHLDIEYEWFLKKVNKRIPINNKNVLETNTYDVGICKDKVYQKQIVSRII